MATAQVKGGLFAQYSSVLVQIRPFTSMRRITRMALSNYGMFALREKMRALNGVVAGSLAQKQLTRVVASDELGGKRPIEQRMFVNANTTAADVTEINDSVLSLSTKTYNGSPRPNLDGNPLGTR